jgi:hypothetical protein
MKIKKITLFLGLNDKNTKLQEISTLDAFKIIQNYLDGGTITEATGFFKHEDGSLIIEKSLKIEVLDFNNDFNIEKTVIDLKKIFNQESIAVQIENITSELL